MGTSKGSLHPVTFSMGNIQNELCDFKDGAFQNVTEHEYAKIPITSCISDKLCQLLSQPHNTEWLTGNKEECLNNDISAFGSNHLPFENDTNANELCRAHLDHQLLEEDPEFLKDFQQFFFGLFKEKIDAQSVVENAVSVNTNNSDVHQTFSELPHQWTFDNLVEEMNCQVEI